MGFLNYHYPFNLRSHVLHRQTAFKVLESGFWPRLPQIHVARMVFIQRLPTWRESMLALAVDHPSWHIFNLAFCSFHRDIQNKKEYWIHSDGFGLSYFDDHRIRNSIGSEYFFWTYKDVQHAEVILNKLSNQYIRPSRGILLWTFVWIFSHWGIVESWGKNQNIRT